MCAKGNEDSSNDFLPLILLVALMLVYLGSLFALIHIMALRDAVLGEFQPFLSPRQSTAINAARWIRQYWPLFLLPLLGLVAVHLLVRKSRVKVILYLALMAVVMIITIIGLSLIARPPLPVLPKALAIATLGGFLQRRLRCF